MTFLDHTQLDTHTQPVGILCTNDRLVEQIGTYKTHNKYKGRISIHSTRFEPTIPVI